MGANTKSVTIDNLVTTTWYNVRKELIDQVYKVTPYFNRMFEKGRIKSRVPDGTHWEIPIQYDKQDQNLQYFTRGTLFGTAEKESMTRLIFYTRNLGNSIVRYWDDDRKNRGSAKLLDYVTSIVDNAKDAIIDKLELDSLAQSTALNSIDALETLISTTPTTGTVGGQSRTGNTYLQNQIKDFTGLTTGNSLLDEMTRMWNLCSEFKGGGKQQTPDVIITTRVIYQDYERVARNMQQIVTNKTDRVSLGFGDLMFKNCEIFYSPSCPSGRMYMLNTGTLEFVYDPSAWMEMTDWKPLAGNSLDKIAQVICVCNQTCNHFQKNGVIYNITATTT